VSGIQRVIVTLAIAIPIAVSARAPVARAQAATATLSGTIVDDSGAVIPDVALTLVNAATLLERRTTASQLGTFTFPVLPPGHYTLTTARDGFAPARLTDIVLNVGDDVTLRIAMKVGALNDTVSVVAEPRPITQSGEVATTVNRQFVENLPLNGRSFQNLIGLSPGVIFTPSNVTSQGQFSVNGQRAGSNYVTVDGVSGNFGTTTAATLYNTAGGGLPALSTHGATTALVSVDALQEFSVHTSSYAAEFGRQPGAQISIVTRSGTNEFHGTLFDYVRNDALDANDYFANASGLPKPALRQNDFGFTVGGPVYLPGAGRGFYDGRNRTFFFVSYEGLRVRQPVVSSPEEVPTLNARASATGIARELLDAFPLPNGSTVGSDPNTATFVGSYSNPSSLDATSVRVDHAVGSRVTLFGRYHHAPSSSRVRADFASTSTIADKRERTRTLTLGATAILSPRLVNDLRVNISQADAASSYFLDDFGGAIPPTSALLDADQPGLFYPFVGNNALTAGLNASNQQRQINVVDTFSYIAGSHLFKTGIDVRRLLPVARGAAYRRFPFFFGVSDILASNVPFLDVLATDVTLHPVFDNYSAFAQDTWRLSPRATLTYGIRYEVVPSPSEAHGNLPLTVDGLDHPESATLAPRGTRLYETTFGNLAPRVGFAYQLSETRGTLLKGGFGVFYDLGYAFAGSGITPDAYPFGRLLSVADAPLDESTLTALPPSATLEPPYGPLFIYQRDFKLPYSLQYNLGIEQALGQRDSVTVAYVGAVGRRLGRVERLQNPGAGLPEAFTRVSIVRNAAKSDYHSLQLQYRRLLSGGLQALASYTWSRSRDTVSDESIVNYQVPTGLIDPEVDRGPSDFDAPHQFSAAVSYQLPSVAGSGFWRALLEDFAIDIILRSRSATPVNVVTNRDPFGLGFRTVSRPDQVPNVPLYLEDSTVAGGRRINSEAFDADAPAAEGRQGNLGRNALRGFPMSQLDVSVHRRLPLAGRTSLELRLDAFNVLNHPNFANPSGVLTDPNFGVSTQMLGRSLGGLSPLYQIGGPRSLQLAVKLMF
jgi:hypothetical protein